MYFLLNWAFMKKYNNFYESINVIYYNVNSIKSTWVWFSSECKIIIPHIPKEAYNSITLSHKKNWISWVIDVRMSGSHMFAVNVDYMTE